MNKTTLPGTDLSVSELSLGTWAFSGAKIWGSNDDGEAVKTVHYALERGINYFDTAEKYGDGKSEEVLGMALEGRRAEAVIATKIYTDKLHHDDVIRQCDASLKRLKTDYIDIYQIHWPNPDIPAEETFGAFEELKRAGKIRYTAVCNAGVNCIRELKQYGVVSNQLPYNLIWRIAEKAIIPASDEAGVPVWAYVPIAQGLLTGKFRSIEDVPMGRRETRFYSGAWKQGRHSDPGFEKEIFEFIGQLMQFCEENGLQPAQVAMNFLKRKKSVYSTLVGARSIQQLEQNIASFETVISDDLMDEIEKKSDYLKEIMGDNADLWEGNGGRFY